MPNYVEMWFPEAGYSFIDGDYKYTVIYEKTKDTTIVSEKTYYTYNSNTKKYEVVENPIQEDRQNYYEDLHHLHAEATNNNKSSYTQIAVSTSFNGITYYVTSLENCFQNCKQLTTAPTISSHITNLDGCFDGCENLQDTIVIHAWPQGGISHTNTFRGTQYDIYVVRKSGTSLREEDVKTLTEGFNNVHFEADDNPAPFISFTYQRGNYDSRSSTPWIPDEGGDDIYISGSTTVATKLPSGWNNELLAQPNGIKIFWNNGTNPITPAAIDIIQEGNEYSFQIYITSQEGTGTITVQATDKYYKSSSYSDYIAQAFILLDFIPGGQGMAVGKAGYRNGLDISIPTAIGEGLELPRQLSYVPTQDSTIDGNKTYYELIDGEYVKVTNPIIEDITNYYEKIYIDNTVDLNNYQLVIGKYNEVNENAIFVVGNGSNDKQGNITYSNLMEVSSDALAFNNKYSEEIFYIGNLDDSTYNKLNWVKYSGESPFIFSLPWDCNFITALKAYSNTYVYDPNINYANNYSVSGREVTINETACNQMIERNIAFISISYSAQGKFPYYTFGSDGIGDIGKYSFRVGENSVASGNTSFASGDSTIASGGNSHSEGYYTTASGRNAHAEGDHTTASGNNAHAEGYYTTASQTYTHAEGYYTTASNIYAHAEGCETVSSNSASHAEGSHTTASGGSAHAEGNYTVADGHHSHAQNDHTIASSNDQTALGKYNIADANDTYAFIIGNGINSNNRSNALSIDWQGNVMGQGMAGQIIMYAGSTRPSGWLFCDGSEYLIDDYPELYAVIGDTYGTYVAPSDSYHFRVPDLRGRVPVGIGNGTATGHTNHTLGQQGGAENAIVPYHTHSHALTWSQSGTNKTLTGSHLLRKAGTSTEIISNASGIMSTYDSTAGAVKNLPAVTDTTSVRSVVHIDATHTHTGTIGGSITAKGTNADGTNASSTNTDGANMQPYIGINYIIATGKTN